MTINRVNKNLLYLTILVFLINFLFNLSEIQFTNIFNMIIFLKLFSFLLTAIFYFYLAKSINYVLKLNSYSLSVVIFLISFFLFNHMVMYFNMIDLDFTVRFIFLLWVLLLISKNKIYDNLLILFSFLTMRFFNRSFYSSISSKDNYVEMNTDVIVQWFPTAKNIYEKGYFYSYTNNLIEGQGLLPSFIQSLLHKINFDTLNFEFVQTNSFLFILFFILIFIDLEISNKNKINLIILFLLIVLNNQWLFYLIVNSLMLEGIVSFLFTTFVINLHKFYRFRGNISFLYFLSFGTLILTKQFISIISLIVLCFCVLLSIKNIYIYIGFLPYVIDYSNKYLLNLNSSIVTYSDGLNYKQILEDIIFLNNLNLSNINKIILNLFVDIPLTIFLLIFIYVNLFSIFQTKKIIFPNCLLFYLSLFNFFLVLVLYISYWQNIEIESSYRYLVNFIGVYFSSIGLVFNNFDD